MVSSPAGNLLLLPRADRVNDAPGYRSEQAASVAACSGAIIETDIPARLDALPFGSFHTLVIVALGVTWILDGLEVTLAGALSGELKDSSGLGLSNEQVVGSGSGDCTGSVRRQHAPAVTGWWRARR